MLQFWRLVCKVDGQQGWLAHIGRPTAPGPIFWVRNELFHDWIGVHVIEFLAQLAAGIDVEVIIAALPEAATTQAPRGQG